MKDIQKNLLDKSYKIADTILTSHIPFISNSWHYDAALTLLGIGALYEKNHSQKYFDYIKQSIDSLINSDGTIKTYNLEDFNVDFINPGNTCFWLYDATGEEKYLNVIQLLKKQLDNQPRTQSGCYYHKLIYPHQVWLDGIYMAEPFHAQYISRFSESKDFSQIVAQIQTALKLTYEPKNGLYVHACDESREAFWADKFTGRSKNVWGRACGWLCMAVVDVLDFVSEDSCKTTLIEILNRLLDAIIKYQDDSGVWYQVLDSRHCGNYKESTCTCMFAYTINKAISKGYISSEKYSPCLEKALYGILDLFISEENGNTYLTNCCKVAGLGPQNLQRRDGSLEYYFSEPITNNDFKGVGPLLKLAANPCQLY